KMKKGAFLCNVSRGPIIDDNALLRALRSGQLESAVLDVFKQEPLTEDSPFWREPGLIVTPHIAGVMNPDEACNVLAQSIRALEDRVHIPGMVVADKYS